MRYVSSSAEADSIIPEIYWGEPISITLNGKMEAARVHTFFTLEQPHTN